MAQSPAAKWELIINDIEPEFAPLAEANGNLVKFAQESRFALDIILASPALQRCPVDSIRKAVRNVAAIGLTLNPVMKLAHLIPRDGVCCLDIGYRGMIKVAVESGAILASKTAIVRYNDPFQYEGPVAVPKHRIDVRLTNEQRGPIVAAYNVAVVPGNAFLTELLTQDDIAQIRNFALAKAKDKNNPSLPWIQWEEEQIKKSGIKRAAKNWPANDRLSAAVALLNENDGAGPIEHDITPGAPRLARAGQLDPAAYAASQQAPESDARTALVKNLELIANQQGTAKYAATWEKLSREQRRLVGVAHHERLKELARAADAASAAAQRDKGR
jgi:recombination protein RecT